MKQVNLRICRTILTLIIGLFLSVGVYAQNITVKGHVKDAVGEVIGANVVEKGNTTNGTITDLDGNFTLSVRKGATLIVSFIGYKSQEVVVNGPSVIVTLQDDAELLSEVVVIGYGTAKKNDLTGSVTAIKPDEMNKGLVTNAQDMMQGKIAGVNVTTGGGTPGGGATIRVRGGSSLNASNDPLVVIDGLAMDNQGVKGLANPLSMVNPADIETFTVLKDASATAIYGSRGSNGVIIITTKKGRSGSKPTISYNGNISVSTKKRTIDVMNGQEYGEFIEKMYGVGSDPWKLMAGALTDDKGNIISLANAVKEGEAYRYNSTDWQNEIYRTAVSHDHNITIAGGLKNMPYRVSLGYTNQNGILKTSNFERYTATVSASPKFFDNHLTINLNAKGMIANNRYADGGAIGAAVYMIPTFSVYNSGETFQKWFGGYSQWTADGTTLHDPTWTVTSNQDATKNPVSLLNQKDDTANSKSFIGNAELDYKIHGFEDLHLHMNIGGDFSTGKQTTVISPSSVYNNCNYYGWNGWEKISKYNKMFNAYAQYTKDFSDAHHFDIMGGYEWQHFYHKGEKDGWGLYQSTNTVTPGEKFRQDAKVWKSENYLVSFFGRANYTLLDRYMLTATVRYDGSSRFKDHWALFPSFAFGWRLKEEAFLKNVDVLSDLKLRLGYGQTGQQEGIGDYNYFASYNVSTGIGSSYPLLDSNGIMYRPNAYNENLTWETTTTYNAGLDFGFLNGKISGSVDYYYRKTTDLLNTVYVSAGSNFRNQVTSNIGSLKNTGVEIALTYRPIQTKDLSWEITANGTYNNNEITELIGQEGYFVPTGGISAGTGVNCQAHAVGHPASSFYVFQQVYDKNGIPIEGAYVDRNGDGIINQDDKYFYKSPAAPWMAGLSSKVMWKNWDFGFSLRASFNNYVYNDLEAGSSNINKGNISRLGFMVNIPTMALGKAWQTNDNTLSDYFVQNATFLKCDNITLGYSFDKLFGAKLGGRVYGAVTNVFTITNYKGIDPEVFGGIDNNLYPRPFTAQLGLTLNF
ncbi:TonB-dependent receptor [Bacteroides helcogenes]|uniref:TonB-dependent receptor plug n=1 Tax=Bacteroides helcogenes (strain ATCC 35417 / DSM 20613 / JCM 6297 / CCUG 15421 / P 36-108) TaxID=693979 RepID=E6SQF2_BACT6|nr:TonB-dependent receptor [Bacteroides helcogenes]ADV44999.1 TonB-dependent receptor plug [Bacteroides helcogenes P 36-108]MDY5239858.1 TonB-dependent receptor [Bacteroides helcogenes]